MPVHLFTRWGDCVSDPSNHEMEVALQELDARDPEHPDCWLSDANEWSISSDENGRVVLQNAETGEFAWRMDNVPRKKVLELWRMLEDGRIEELKLLKRN